MRTNGSKKLLTVLILIGLGASLSFAAAPATPQGTITGKGFLNISGTAVTDLTGNAKFPDNPDVKYYYPYFEWNADPGGDISIPANNAYGENYGVQMQGYFYPPSTGDYIFFLAADDGAQLFLSTDDNPANKKLIAQEAGWSNPRSWDAIGGGSVLEEKNSSTFAGTQWETKDTATGGAKITLTQGRAYYIEALMKEGGGGDNLAVAVQDPAGAIDQTLPIPGARLSPFGTSAAAQILSHPQDAAAFANGTATFSVGLDLPPGVTITSTKWTKNGVDIPNSDTNALTLQVAAADNNAKIRAIVTTSAGVLTSEEATLSVATFTPEFAQGVVKFEAYTDIGGATDVASLTSNDKYIANTPDDVRLIAGIDSPNAYGDNYGAKVSGFIIPPESGQFRFFIRSDDASQFWLSTDTNEANAVMIAEETGCCNAFTEPDAGTTRTSEPQTLVAGNRYAFYALVKEGGGGDFLQVAVRKEGDTTAAASLRPLGGTWVGVNAKPDLGVPQITKQPTAPAQIEAGRDLNLTVEGVVNPTGFNFPILVQWQKDGQNIPGAIGTTLTITNVQTASAGTYRAVVSAPGGSSTNSDNVVITVVTDVTPPSLVSAGALGTKVGVMFDEAVDPATAATAANYTVSGVTVSGATVYQGKQVILDVSAAPSTNFTVSVINVKDVTGNVIVSNAVTGELSELKAQDVGEVGVDPLKPGYSVSFGKGSFLVAGLGHDIWDNADGFQFAFKEVTGPFDARMRVEYMNQGASTWAKTELMVRESTDAGSRHNSVCVTRATGENAIEAQWRDTTDGASGNVRVRTPVPYPNAWVRLVREDATSNEIDLYTSTDGVTWEFENTHTTPAPILPATVLVGIAVTSHQNTEDEPLAEGLVHNFQVRPFTPTSDSQLKIARDGADVSITWASGTLVSSPTVDGTYTPVTGATSPFKVTPATGSTTFYKVQQ